MKQEQWQEFEKECCDYLQDKYTQVKFTLNGGHGSKNPDIVVTKNGETIFNIEAKMNEAQCGQFVLFPNETTRKFDFSKKNLCPQNICQPIINELEKDFDNYKKPSSKKLKINNKLLINWVINYYTNVKNSKFFITGYNNDFIIFPTNKIAEYFDVSAEYRYKKSGSSNPSVNNIEDIQHLLKKEKIKYNKLEYISKYLHVELPDKQDKDSFLLKGAQYTYLLKLDADRKDYRITRLSNTCNANVIFSIKLKKEQDNQDLILFDNNIK